MSQPERAYNFDNPKMKREEKCDTTGKYLAFLEAFLAFSHLCHVAMTERNYCQGDAVLQQNGYQIVRSPAGFSENAKVYYAAILSWELRMVCNLKNT